MRSDIRAVDGFEVVVVRPSRVVGELKNKIKRKSMYAVIESIEVASPLPPRSFILIHKIK